MNPVYDLEADVEWEGVDPSEWRALPDPDDPELDDDQEEGNQYVNDVLGFDVDELF